MAEEENAEEEAAAAAAKKKKMIIGGVLAAGAIYRFVLSGGAAEEVPEAMAAVEEVDVAEGEILPIPEMTLNLADPEALHFARIGLAAVLLEGEDPVIAEGKLPIIQDIVIDVVGNRTFAELREPGIKNILRDEISEKTREAFDGETVSRVIFTSFVMQ
ncbi:MAG: flagellar basal body-associated FliL family protein [Acidimicrobiales bacterium]